MPVGSDPFYSVVINPCEKRSSERIDQKVATVMGLTLQKTGDVSNTFRRVGMFCWTERLLFDSISISHSSLT